MGKSGQVNMIKTSGKVKCAVIGANGLIGRNIGSLFTGSGIPWAGTYNKRSAAGLVKLDITSPRDLKRFFSDFSPDAVFHCANLTGGVDFCESNPKAAEDFHLNATKEIGTLCKATGATFIFISTDYIFDGTRAPYKEDDAPNPLNLYGRLKLKTEEWIKANLNRYLIIRTTNVYGWDPQTVTPNFVMSLYRSLEAKKTFNAPSFLYGNPTYAPDLTKAIVELHREGAQGVFHVVGKSAIDRFEWARKACSVLGLDFSLVKEIKAPSAGMVPRPFRSLLDTHKFQSSYSTTLYDATGGLVLMKEEMRPLRSARA